MVHGYDFSIANIRVKMMKSKVSSEAHCCLLTLQLNLLSGDLVTCSYNLE